MTEVSSTVKNFTISINQQFAGGTLFLLLSDQEFKKFLMETSSKMLEENSPGCQKHAARIIGKNQKATSHSGSSLTLFRFQAMVCLLRLMTNHHFCGYSVW